MSSRKRHPSKTADLLTATGLAHRTWIWCLHCARCYQAGEYRQQGQWQLCPYPDCAGDTVLDAVPWAQRRLYHPEYPGLPERNTVYPQG